MVEGIEVEVSTALQVPGGCGFKTELGCSMSSFRRGFREVCGLGVYLCSSPVLSKILRIHYRAPNNNE